MDISRDDVNATLQDIIANVSLIAPLDETDTGQLLNLLASLTSCHFEREANYELSDKSDISQVLSFYEKLLSFRDSSGQPRVKSEAYDLTLQAESTHLGIRQTQAYQYSRGAGNTSRNSRLFFGIGALDTLKHRGEDVSLPDGGVSQVVLRSLREYHDERDARSYLYSAMNQIINPDITKPPKLLPYKKLL